jgi:hypothetical protein
MIHMFHNLVILIKIKSIMKKEFELKLNLFDLSILKLFYDGKINKYIIIMKYKYLNENF